MNCQVDIFSELGISELVVCVAKEGSRVISVENRCEGLEGYFISMLEGDSDA